ncbi:HNH endonuclease [Balneolaceae bacterium ANBcel3]|nr:HNH endonuclease [Balneolaceae bacterium ANBcel3]
MRLNGNVLVLNQDYQPLSVCNVKKSILLLLLEKAEMLHDIPVKKIRTIRSEYEYPSVIRLRKYAKIPYKNIVLSRKNILKRDNNRCLYCGSREALTIDHVIPKSRGGSDTWENLVSACNPCNHKKGNKTPKEAGMKLLSKPFRPNHIIYLRDFYGNVHETWKPYLYY